MCNQTKIINIYGSNSTIIAILTFMTIYNLIKCVRDLLYVN